MSKIIGLSGAQGSGKSTLLTALAERGLHVDQFKVSRAVQKELGWSTLESVMDSPEAMIIFQEAIFKQKYDNDLRLKDKGHVVLTERTFADILAYTVLWTGKFIDQKVFPPDVAESFLAEFTERCWHAQMELYSATLLLPMMDHIQWEHDANRASLSDADQVYYNIVQFAEVLAPHHCSFIISAADVNKRADQVESFLNT